MEQDPLGTLRSTSSTEWYVLTLPKALFRVRGKD